MFSPILLNILDTHIHTCIHKEGDTYTERQRQTDRDRDKEGERDGETERDKMTKNERCRYGRKAGVAGI